MKQIEELKLQLDSDFFKRVAGVRVDGELYVRLEDVNVIFGEVVWRKTMKEISDVINKNSIENACVEIREKYNALIIERKDCEDKQNEV